MAIQRRMLRAAVAAACSLVVGAGLAADWLQLQNGPARWGYSPEKIDVPLKRAWVVGLSPERLFPQVQPVIAGGRVLLGTAMGNFHAFEATTGTKLWSFPGGRTDPAHGGRRRREGLLRLPRRLRLRPEYKRRQPGLEVR
jgi:outer membrane protein assembly factor BamB